MKYVFISPHPDDSEFGCGGTIAKLTAQGHHCVIAVLMSGDVPMMHSGKVATFEARKREQERAAIVLGAEFQFLQVGQVGSLVPSMQSIAAIDTLLAEEPVAAVFAPQPSFNQDHRAAWEIVHAAFRPGRPSTKDTKLYMYEIPHDGANAHGLFGGVCGKTYVGLSATELDTKVEAINCHQTQVVGRKGGVTGSEASAVLARMRGIESQNDYAELFYLVKGVGL